MVNAIHSREGFLWCTAVSSLKTAALNDRLVNIVVLNLAGSLKQHIKSLQGWGKWGRQPLNTHSNMILGVDALPSPPKVAVLRVFKLGNSIIPVLEPLHFGNLNDHENSGITIDGLATVAVSPPFKNTMKCLSHSPE